VKRDLYNSECGNATAGTASVNKCMVLSLKVYQQALKQQPTKSSTCEFLWIVDIKKLHLQKRMYLAIWW